MQAITIIDTTELQHIIKLIQWGLRTTTLHQILGDSVHKEAINQLAREYNPEVRRQGKTISKPPLDTTATRMLTTWVCLLYRQIRTNLPEASVPQTLVRLYEDAYNISKHPMFPRAYRIDEIYAIIVAYNNGIIKLVTCAGDRASEHPGNNFEFVLGCEEPILGCCPLCARKRQEGKSIATLGAKKPYSRPQKNPLVTPPVEETGT